MEDGKKMNRKQVVALMVETIEDYNRVLGNQQSVPKAQVEAMITQMKQQVVMANELLYDTLKDKGVII